MLENVFPRAELIGLARQKAKDFIAKTVHPAAVEEEVADGWTVKKQRKRSARLVRPKPKSTHFEDRVWTLFYRLGFEQMSGERGGKIKLSGAEDSPNNQIDCIAIDSEVGLCIECKSFNEPRRDPAFQEKLARLAALRRSFAESVPKQFPQPTKRHLGMVMFTFDIIASEPDRKRAEEQNIALLDERDLAYYESLLSHLGPAAKYQILADIFPLKQIPGLKITVPALQTKFGDHKCYTFSIKPEYLLKIAFVSHRAKGKGSDVDAYQRMIKKSRLKRIRDYISEDGIFPTNIVLNLENSKYVRFDLGKQEGSSEGARVGWLTLEPAYKSAWVIDGQHRLFAYSGHKRASTGHLSVVAFEDLPGHIQAKLFVDINHEQKSVKRSLLDELWAELHWDASDPEKRVRAIISKAIQGLNDDKESPFYGRILLSDAEKTDKTCISLSSVLGALDKPGFHISTLKRGVIQHGPLWTGKNEATATRTQRVINAWFQKIAAKANEWWDRGSGDGGGLAMNDGVTICINVLRSVLEHLQQKFQKLIEMDDKELVEQLMPFAEALGEHLGRMSETERSQFRALRGVQGQTAGTRSCQQAIHSSKPEFNPAGLQDYIERQKANTNDKAREIIARLEKTLQATILSMLKGEFPNPDQWWFDGVPKGVRKKVDERVNESDGKHGGREENFDLIHYREVATHNWALFEPTLAYGTGSKEKRTDWLAEINGMRNIVMHPSRRQYLSIEQLAKLQDYDEWLQSKVSGVGEPDHQEQSAQNPA